MKRILLMSLLFFGSGQLLADSIYRACAVRNCARLHRAALRNCRASCWQHTHKVHAAKNNLA